MTTQKKVKALKAIFKEIPRITKLLDLHDSCFIRRGKTRSNYVTNKLKAKDPKIIKSLLLDEIELLRIFLAKKDSKVLGKLSKGQKLTNAEYKYFKQDREFVFRAKVDPKFKRTRRKILKDNPTLSMFSKREVTEEELYKLGSIFVYKKHLDFKESSDDLYLMGIISSGFDDIYTGYEEINQILRIKKFLDKGKLRKFKSFFDKIEEVSKEINKISNTFYKKIREQHDISDDEFKYVIKGTVNSKSLLGLLVIRRTIRNIKVAEWLVESDIKLEIFDKLTGIKKEAKRIKVPLVYAAANAILRHVDELK